MERGSARSHHPEDGREYALSIASDTQVTEVTFAGGVPASSMSPPEYARKLSGGPGPDGPLGAR